MTAVVAAMIVPPAHADSLFQFAPEVVSAPDSRGFSNSTSGNGSLVSGTLATQGGFSYNFLDTWQFTLGSDALVGGFVGSLNFVDTEGHVTQGIANLQLRLVDGNGQVVAGGAWQSVAVTAGVEQVFSVIAPASFAAGHYALQVRGLLQGPSSAYAGTLQALQPVAAVPLPGSLPLLAAGLALMSFIVRRRL